MDKKTNTKGVYKSFYADREQIASLDALAKERGVTRSTLIREGIEATYGFPANVRKTSRSTPNGTAAG